MTPHRVLRWLRSRGIPSSGPVEAPGGLEYIQAGDVRLYHANGNWLFKPKAPPARRFTSLAELADLFDHGVP